MIICHCGTTSMEFRLCDCNYAKPIFLKKLIKLNFDFYTLGRPCFQSTSYHSGEKLSLAIVGTFVLLSLSNPGCLPIPYNVSVNGTHCTHFLFSLVSKCICYWERWPKLKDIEKMIICPIAKNKCFVWKYVIQDMLSTNKH